MNSREYSTFFRSKFMKIDRVRSLHVAAEWDYQEPLGEAHLSRPESIYPELAPAPKWPLDTSSGPPYPAEAHFLLIDTDDGATGICGPVGDEDIAIIKRSFAELLIGEDPHATERIWDKMYRRGIHARKGTPMMALSKVDLALWDSRASCSARRCINCSAVPRDRASAPTPRCWVTRSSRTRSLNATRHFLAQGFTAFKWFMPCAPKDGEPGIRKNLAVIRAAREAAGPDVDLMFDAWSSWSVPYTQRMVELSREYRPYWFEEPVLADLIPQYAELRRSVSGVFISGGEHEYTRWGIKALLTPARSISCKPMSPGLAASARWSKSAPWHRLTPSRSSPITAAGLRPI